MHFASCIALEERISVSHLHYVLDERREVGDGADGSERMIGLREGKGYTRVLAGMEHFEARNAELPKMLKTMLVNT